MSSKAGIGVFTQVKFFVKVDNEFEFCFSEYLREFIVNYVYKNFVVIMFMKKFFGVEIVEGNQYLPEILYNPI